MEKIALELEPAMLITLLGTCRVTRDVAENHPRLVAALVEPNLVVEVEAKVRRVLMDAGFGRDNPVRIPAPKAEPQRWGGDLGTIRWTS